MVSSESKIQKSLESVDRGETTENMLTIYFYDVRPTSYSA